MCKKKSDYFEYEPLKNICMIFQLNLEFLSMEKKTFIVLKSMEKYKLPWFVLLP